MAAKFGPDEVVLPSGTTEQRPVGASAGSARFNTSTGSIEFFDGSTWISTNLIPTIDSVTGTIYTDEPSNLTVSVTNATETVTVRFSEGGSVVEDVVDVDMSTGSASVAVPASVYGQSAGDTITVSVINQDGTPSSNAITKTVVGLPTGGTTTLSGGYRYHTFTSSGTFTVPSGFSESAEVLTIAGGGGAGYDVSGGGGAGGVVYTTFTASVGSYTALVGAGGVGSNNFSTGPSQPQGGSNSRFHNFTTAIGGGHGANYQTNGDPGGSGGGGAYQSRAGGAGTSGQGNNGGNGSSAAYFAGGGGGAGGAGGTPAGGIGTNSYSAWASATGTGDGGYYAGGGGGGYSSGSAPGGAGGGGDGNLRGTTTPGQNGQVNTGGGGGGVGGWSPTGPAGGSGGSGIIIVRYPF